MNAALIRQLGEARCTREDGQVGILDLLAREGLPVPEGFVLTRDSHRDFLGVSGIAERLQAFAKERSGEQAEVLSSDAPEKHQAEEMLTLLVRDAVLNLGARTVAVLSENLRRGGLGSLPEVLLAVRQAWLSEEDLRRQAATAAAGCEIPTWPVLVQSEPRPEYTGWSTTDDLREESQHPSRKIHRGRIVLHDLESAHPEHPFHKSIARLTREAGSALGEPFNWSGGSRKDDGTCSPRASSPPKGVWVERGAGERGLRQTESISL